MALPLAPPGQVILSPLLPRPEDVSPAHLPCLSTVHAVHADNL